MNQSYLNSAKNAVLSSKPSKAIRLLLMVLFVCLFANVASAQTTNTWKGSTNNNWNTAANWSSNKVPTSADDVLIPLLQTAVIDISTAVCNSLTINGTLILGNNNTDRNLTVSGDVTINTTGSFISGGNGGNKLSIGANLVNDGKFDMNINAADTEVTFNGTSSQTISGTGVTMDFNSLTLTSSSTFNVNRMITLNRNWTNNGKTVSGSGIVTLTGTCIIGGSAVTAFPNLTVEQQGNGRLVTQEINTTVSGDFKLTAGTFQLNNATSYSLTILGNYVQTGGVFNFNAGKSGTSTMNVAGNFEISSTGNITETGKSTGGSIVFNKSGTQTYTSGGTVTNTVNFTVNSGSTLQMATPTTVVTGNSFVLSSGATLGITSAAGITANGATGNIRTATRTFDQGASYTYNGTSAQAAGNGLPSTVKNLNISNSAEVIFGQLTKITNNFSIATGSKANLGTLTHSAETLTIGDEGAVAGSWGSTSSPAVNPNNTFFAATGIVNVGTSSYTTTIYDGNSWSKGTPTSRKNIIFNFNGSYTAPADFTAYSCTVTSGTVTIPSGKNLILGSALTISGGSLTFENNASLVQTAFTGANTGNIIYKRTTSILNNNYDFVYWGSPVNDQKLGTIWMASNWNDTFYSFDSQTNNWARNTAVDSMTPGKGYIARARNGQSGLDYTTLISSTFNVLGTWTAKFYGVPNNGDVTVTNITGGKSCLLGNPYPSAIDADAFLGGNLGLDGTIYFWTHNTIITNNTYSSNDYAAYNSVGGVASALSDPKHSVAGVDSGKKPSGKIAAGQAFFANATTSANVVFKNTMRVAGGQSGVENSQFFRTTNTKAKTTTTSEKNRVWLNLSNNQGAFKQTLIGYLTDAMNDYDSRFDGESFDGNQFVDFYSVNKDKNLVIQGRALPFDENDEVPLGYRTTINGEFTINIDQVDGVLANRAVFIEDKLTNTVFDLKSGKYTFNTAAGTFNDRFVLKYSNKTLGVDKIEKEDGILAFYSNNYDTLIIHNDNVDTTVNSVSLFNMAGQNIGVWNVRDSEQKNIQIPVKKMSSGIYIVKAKTTAGESSKKIMVN